MDLRISNPRARELARQLAEKRKISIAEAVIEALQSELQRESESFPLAKRLAAIADGLGARAAKNGRAMGKDEIDEMWGIRPIPSNLASPALSI
ncbi:transcriptional regulator [Mesorhizobium tamadayense]|uniref:Transcriptional regulator n=1 Tax=Mesorhizobium tamadayense TaxID=425306 RepID=A0A3P3FX18_9HYPH|nr:type II toxin-antitoxin system VapB family antitoxin [Mesorhizobium tamadayense]RRI03064.1 transcriptional regulator [Mesorhizobium tamadayense]